MAVQFFTPRGPHNEIIKLPTSLRRTVKWLPQIGDIVPDFTVETTQGVIRFWEWVGGSWVHLFGIPKANTPVCTTELVSVAASADAWKASGIKHLALTGSTVGEQIEWHDDISAIFGTEIDFPGAHDPGLKLTRLFGMLHDKQSRDCGIRKSFVIDPAHQIRMIFEYPLNVGRNTEEILRVIKALQMRAGSGVAIPADWYFGDMVIINDGRPEAEVIAEFGSPSIQLTPYLRVVTPCNGPAAPETVQRNAPDIFQDVLS